ncbi:MAG TPA: hypothetical protein VMM55_11360 [Thermohalobaculum sp.]|nr:hypothetical protein [Thermohalobaculum sp.]
MARKSDKSRGPADPARRRLLTAAPLAGAAALASRPALAGEEGQGDAENPRDTVYRVTDHVRAYYARARG